MDSQKDKAHQTMRSHIGAESSVNMLTSSLSVLLTDRIREELNDARKILQEVRFFSVWVNSHPGQASEAVQRLIESLTEGRICNAKVVPPVTVNIINQTTEGNTP